MAVGVAVGAKLGVASGVAVSAGPKLGMGSDGAEAVGSTGAATVEMGSDVAASPRCESSPPQAITRVDSNTAMANAGPVLELVIICRKLHIQG